MEKQLKMKTKLFYLLFFLMLINQNMVIAQTQFRTIAYDEALSAAQQEGKMVFIDFYTDWCGPCKRMSREVFPQDKVGNFLNHKFICIKLNAEKEGKELAKLFQVKAYPTFLIVNTSKQVVFRLEGAMDTDAFISRIENGIDPNQKPERLAQRYQSGERSAELINNYAFSLMTNDKEQEGYQVVNEYFKTLSNKQRLLPRNLFLFTRYTVSLDDEKAKFLLQNEALFPKESSQKVTEHLDKLIAMALSSYFSGYRWSEKKFHEAEYQWLKQLIKKRNTESADVNEAVFTLIESRVKNSDEKFLQDCIQQYDILNKVYQETLIMNLGRLFPNPNKLIIPQIATFIRGKLYDMPPSVIILSGHILNSLAEKMNQ